ncbi:tetratricopeptide repeat protein [Pelagibius litoralis]|uniref:Tetratricopeptide repeat protein n=1 Tax=Pelagibius litoralis TaxID=374515 RepID=A0A967K8J4_9PROT|nr:tetratricopeptide repeat protein [Pelagibius litoralis]NIA69282.1 tetratricopeptide repeat protein [Pelagibius litoralis]
MPSSNTAAQNNPPAANAPGYVTTAVCAGCHVEEHAEWQDSHHDWALKEATEKTVLGDFNGGSFEQQGEVWRFSRRGDNFIAESHGDDGTWVEHKVLYSVGVAPLQQYLVMLDGGRLQALTVAWDVQAERWFHLYPGPKVAEGDGLHWTRTFNNWNSRCADCHSTGYIKGLDPRGGTFDSRWSDLNVGCESCHGPGEAHVAWAQKPDDTTGRGFTAKPGNEIEVCAACHARRQALGAESRPAGAPFLDHFVPALLREGLYHADGQILDEVYVYGSFLQSRMYAKGVTCSNCHAPHTARLKAEGNALCTACHSPTGNDAFPSLRNALYDSPDHHFHEAGSDGAACVNCHMAERTYMIVDPRRDHSFRVPRPDLSAALGTPNTCTDCHMDKDPAWAAAELERRFPTGRSGEPHFGKALAAGRRSEGGAESTLLSLALDEAQPVIARATALDLLRGYGPSPAEAAAALLSHKAPLLRRGAALLQESAAGERRIDRLAPLLEDPIRAVRIAAARLLIDVPDLAFPAQAVLPFEKAAAEYRTSLLASADLPETQMNLAALALRTGYPQAAEAAVKRALALNGHFEDAWLRLGELQHSRSRGAAAVETFRSGLTALPDSGRLHAALGLLQIERGALAEGISELKTAADLRPGDARLRYNLALALSRSNQPQAAEKRMREALSLAPDDPEMLYGLGFLLVEQGRTGEASEIARQLRRLHPQRLEGPALVDEIGRRRSP